MNKKRKIAIAFVVVLFILVALEIVYIFSELYSESDIPNEPTITDAIKFKNEYESINGEKNSSGKDIRVLSIPDDNPFIYSSADEIVEKMNNKETFIVYFGFKNCPWCRSVLPSLIESAKENNVTKIYYVDVLGIRDKYELDENNKAVRTVEGSEGYYKLLASMGNVLDDYEPLTYKVKKKTKKVKIGEKRIYAPNVVAVKDGVAIALETGIVPDLTDAYMEIDDGLKCQFKEKFKCLFETIKNDDYVCSVEDQKC